jgi:hypothetical protein
VGECIDEDWAGVGIQIRELQEEALAPCDLLKTPRAIMSSIQVYRHLSGFLNRVSNASQFQPCGLSGEREGSTPHCANRINIWLTPEGKGVDSLSYGNYAPIDTRTRMA